MGGMDLRKHIKRSLQLLLIVVQICMTGVKAEQKQEFGPYEVHYIALPTTILEPTVAQQMGLVRSKSSGFLNISVIKNLEDGSKKSVAAFIKGSIRNRVQQKRSLEFIRKYEGRAVYQLANFWYSQGEIMTFTLEIQADPNNPPFSIKFNQALYPD